jgi:hypothetical protein
VIAAVFQAIKMRAALFPMGSFFAGCRHKVVGWPIRDTVLPCSYQVCLACGKKRIFDENNFTASGPFGHDLAELLKRSAARQPTAMSDHSSLPLSVDGTAVDASHS